MGDIGREGDAGGAVVGDCSPRIIGNLQRKASVSGACRRRLRESTHICDDRRSALVGVVHVLFLVASEECWPGVQPIGDDGLQAGNLGIR